MDSDPAYARERRWVMMMMLMLMTMTILRFFLLCTSLLLKFATVSCEDGYNFKRKTTEPSAVATSLLRSMGTTHSSSHGLGTPGSHGSVLFIISDEFSRRINRLICSLDTYTGDADLLSKRDVNANSQNILQFVC